MKPSKEILEIVAEPFIQSNVIVFKDKYLPEDAFDTILRMSIGIEPSIHSIEILKIVSGAFVRANIATHGLLSSKWVFGQVQAMRHGIKVAPIDILKIIVDLCKEERLRLTREIITDFAKKLKLELQNEATIQIINSIPESLSLTLGDAVTRWKNYLFYPAMSRAGEQIKFCSKPVFIAKISSFFGVFRPPVIDVARIIIHLSDNKLLLPDQFNLVPFARQCVSPGTPPTPQFDEAKNSLLTMVSNISLPPLSVAFGLHLEPIIIENPSDILRFMAEHNRRQLSEENTNAVLLLVFDLGFDDTTGVSHMYELHIKRDNLTIHGGIKELASVHDSFFDFKLPSGHELDIGKDSQMITTTLLVTETCLNQGHFNFETGGNIIFQSAFTKGSFFVSGNELSHGDTVELTAKNKSSLGKPKVELIYDQKQKCFPTGIFKFFAGGGK